MPAKHRVLLVDDERGITTPLIDLLEQAGYEVATATDGIAALEQVEQFQPHLIVLDVIMPRMDGREVLRRLRERGDWTPVILLTRVQGSIQRATALDEGADDYLTKPYDPYELLARIRAVLRRAGPRAVLPASTTILVSEELTLDRPARRVCMHGREVNLTPKAVALLEYLMSHSAEVFTREQLLDAVWGWAYAGGIRVVDMRIGELRREIGDDANHPRYIETVPGVGYRFIAPVEAGR
jgi:DNA-binding response OmpR family regulator